MAEPGKVIDLRQRAGFRPDIAGMAREQMVNARRRLGLSEADFADRLSAMLGWTPSPEVIESWETSVVPPGDALVAANFIVQGTAPVQSAGYEPDLISEAMTSRYADVTDVFPTRSEFVSAMPSHELFDQAHDVKAAGLSLNLVCQQYSANRLQDRVRAGAKFKLLFLDPQGDAIKQRELEEGYPPGHLSALTHLNIQTAQYRVRDRLPAELRPSIEIAVYDEVIRFNIILLDGKLGVIQPYLPEARGIDSPTFVIRRKSPVHGVFNTFEQIFTALWERGQPL